MNASASEPLSQPPGSFVLPMRDMAQMFNAPPVDPLSQQLETWRQVKAETLHVLLPDDKASLDLVEQTRHALQRYASMGSQGYTQAAWWNRAVLQRRFQMRQSA